MPVLGTHGYDITLATVSRTVTSGARLCKAGKHGEDGGQELPF